MHYLFLISSDGFKHTPLMLLITHILIVAMFAALLIHHLRALVVIHGPNMLILRLWMLLLLLLNYLWLLSVGLFQCLIVRWHFICHRGNSTGLKIHCVLCCHCWRLRELRFLCLFIQLLNCGHIGFRVLKFYLLLLLLNRWQWIILWGLLRRRRWFHHWYLLFLYLILNRLWRHL